jgi:hypothetical protein
VGVGGGGQRGALPTAERILQTHDGGAVLMAMAIELLLLLLLLLLLQEEMGRRLPRHLAARAKPHGGAGCRVGYV